MLVHVFAVTNSSPVPVVDEMATRLRVWAPENASVKPDEVKPDEL